MTQFGKYETHHQTAGRQISNWLVAGFILRSAFGGDNDGRRNEANIISYKCHGSSAPPARASKITWTVFSSTYSVCSLCVLSSALYELGGLPEVSTAPIYSTLSQMKRGTAPLVINIMKMVTAPGQNPVEPLTGQGSEKALL